MTTNYDPHTYANLLVEYLPGVIQTEEENERAIEFAGRLMKKGEGKRSPEEDRLLDLLVTLIDDFEERHIRWAKHRTLQLPFANCCVSMN